MLHRRAVLSMMPVMLNYIWAGLIAVSLLFAMWTDVGALWSDTYRGGAAMPVRVEPAGDAELGGKRTPVRVWIDPAAYIDFYRLGQDKTPEQLAALEADLAERFAEPFEGRLIQTEDGPELLFAKEAELPPPLDVVFEFSSSREGELRGAVTGLDEALAGRAGAGETEAQPIAVGVRFDKVKFKKLNDITAAAFDLAEVAVTIAIGLIGVLALWLGLVKIAEASGLIDLLVRVIQPVLHPLFPEIPKGHPAIGMIALNMSANILGLGNAATPMGLKAMEEMQKLNPRKDTASNSMVMFLAVNTASVQLLPSATLVALMGLQAAELLVAIIIVTGLSLVIAIVSAKLLGRLPGYRRSDPLLAGPGPAENSDDSGSDG